MCNLTEQNTYAMAIFKTAGAYLRASYGFDTFARVQDYLMRSEYEMTLEGSWTQDGGFEAETFKGMSEDAQKAYALMHARLIVEQYMSRRPEWFVQEFQEELEIIQGQIEAV